MIKVDKVSFGYTKDKIIFNDLTTTFKTNKITGLIGRNGSGKTTLISLINTLLVTNSGIITFDDSLIFENEKVLDEIATVRSVYPILYGNKVKKGLKIFKKNNSRFDIEKAINLLNIFNLDPNKKMNKLSRGEASIFYAIVGLSISTRVIIFDEVELGMDDEKKNIFYEQILLDQQENPKTIIISTNVFSNTKEIFDEVKLIHKNEIILDDSYQTILNDYIVYTYKDKSEIYNFDYRIIEKTNTYIKVLLKSEDAIKVSEGLKDKPSLELLFEILTRNEVR
ncbi:ATP-binding cassette domain-containing protein [Haploplasma axanthum]|uniref:ABC transporter ATP-binding protein n=1 Tax=Haploplasma axanthum TaxID=29552 RepID=A0A449BBY7_HAPAX|nr:ATP-binding cassette domain-containing protein [Haploplasma axanthum]VEU79955.1 ABC transporter ATP-binding protein [Haploplasma axanthum]